MQDIGCVFDVEDRDQVPTGKCQAVVERLGLRAGFARRDQNQLELQPWIAVTQDFEGLLVVFFDQEHHLEPIDRIVDLSNVVDQLADDRNFPIGGNHDRIRRQVNFGNAQGLLVAHDLDRVALRRPHEEDDPVGDGNDVHHREEGDDDGQGHLERKHQSHRNEEDDPDDEVALSLRDEIPGGDEGNPIG